MITPISVIKKSIKDYYDSLIIEENESSYHLHIDDYYKFDR